MVIHYFVRFQPVILKILSGLIFSGEGLIGSPGNQVFP